MNEEGPDARKLDEGRHGDEHPDEERDTDASDDDTDSRWSVVITVLKVLVSVGSFGYLLWKFPVEQAFETMFQMKAIYLVLLVPIVVLPIFLTSRSLQLLYEEYEKIRFLPIFKVDTVDFVVNSFLPTRLGTLATTPLILNKYTGIKLRRAFVIKGVQLQMIAAINGLVALAGLFLLVQYLERGLALVLLVSAGAYLSIPVGVFLLAWVDLPSFISDRAPKLLSSAAEMQHDILSPNKVKSAGLLFLSFVVLSGVRFGVIGTSQGLELSPLLYLLIPTLVYSVTVLPISIGGIGITEVTGTTVLVALGVPPGLAASVVVLDRIFAAYLPLVLLYVYANYVIHSDVSV
ncbi:lysylphosphatidylglycerol synthase transmembrane domain-containing protein [Haladaptatus sp. AB643]|uniref:lysylphosphatidylglycerol synthase transmembrane domain-containing protein n=1 Tax=Haladaptatus sp. AB643 TaxID=2934174 RepID=UPI00209BE899|nr:lysylphosphatidylglycerol synthase transmembrane domain-containing protein [Haladaptatus sp. AB643]MCO8246697.1 flippase-like domain-containing protein [Haladaptatus sp. AB643]